MSFERSSLRYAHTNGHTSLKYVTTTDGNCIFTCGSDGDIRKWKGIDDDDPSSSCLGEFVLCIEQDFEENNKNGRLLASTDRNTVQSYSLPEIDCTGTLMRFTALVTCIRATENYIAAGSEDMEIKVLFKSESKELVLQGHKGPILSLDVYDSKKLLASVGGDGVLIVWSLEDGKEIKRIMGNIFIFLHSFYCNNLFDIELFKVLQNPIALSAHNVLELQFLSQHMVLTWLIFKKELFTLSTHQHGKYNSL